MNRGPRISVILPTIRVDAWLDLAIESVLAEEQTPLELIVVHDGVPVSSAKEWVQDPKVTCVRIERRSGLANALATGISHSKAEYVARLDADDLSMPGRFSKQMHFLDANPDVVLVGTLAHRINGRGNVTGQLGEKSDDPRRRLLDRNAIMHSSVMFRRRAYDEAGGYDATLKQMEDYELWLRMAKIGSFHVLSEPLIGYRVHGQQMSRGASPYSNYVRVVSRQRRLLAKQLGQSGTGQRIRNLMWWSAQFLRFHRLRVPGYTRGL